MTAPTRASSWAHLCEIFLAITNIGTAVVLWPIVKRQSETLALSYVASRVVESVIIVVGLISLLSGVTLREDFAGAGADAGSLSIAGESLVAIHDTIVKGFKPSPILDDTRYVGEGSHRPAVAAP